MRLNILLKMLSRDCYPKSIVTARNLPMLRKQTSLKKCQGSLKEEKKAHKPGTCSVCQWLLLKGLTTSSSNFCVALQQFGFEDVVDFCFTFIILIMKMLPKLKFELFPILINERGYCLVLYSDDWLCAGNRRKHFSQLLRMSFDKCSLVLGCSVHHSDSEAVRAQKFQNQNRTSCAPDSKPPCSS